MRRIFQWFNRRFGELDLLPDYSGLLFSAWQALLWGGSIMAVAWGLWFIVAVPPNWLNWIAIFIALFLAGYFVWRSDHIRLLPKLEVSEIRFQSTPTAGGGHAVYVQLLPKCLTEASIKECSGHLKSVHRWSEELQQWEETAMNESVRLQWSHGDNECSPITLEPDNERRLNVFMVHDSTGPRINPLIHPVPIRMAAVFEADDTFRFNITVRGKDCSPVNINLRVRRGTQWDHPLAEMIPD